MAEISAWRLLSSVIYMIAWRHAAAEGDSPARGRLSQPGSSSSTTRVSAAPPTPVYWIGRTLPASDGRVIIDWPGVAACLTVENASVVLAEIEDKTPTGTRFTVLLDDAGVGYKRLPIATFQTRPGRVNYTLIEGLELSRFLEHPTISLIHTQEERFFDDSHKKPGATVALTAFYTDGTMIKTLEGPPFLQKPKRKMEVIGDSVTTGYGAMGLSPCRASIYTNDYRATYASLLSEAFGAETYVEAVSGAGMYSSFPSLHPQNIYGPQDSTMPEHWIYTLSAGAGREDAALWDPSLFRPDVVVINLGTNDLCCERNENKTFVQLYISEYVSFVEHLAKAYDPVQSAQTTPYFFLAVGPMADNYFDAVQSITGQLNTTSLPGKVSLLDMRLSPDVAASPRGCDNHPSHLQHQVAYLQARQQMAKVLGWEYEDIPL